MKKICVIGYPAKHSLSPSIHHYWMEKYGIEGKYEIREIEPDKFDGFFQNLYNEGYIGCNVTVPYKERAFKFIEESGNILNKPTKILGVVNTVLVKNGIYEGLTTDGDGFYSNLLTSGIDFHEGKFVILGAGGAARAIIGVLLEKISDSSEIIIINRTKHKAEKIKTDLSVEGVRTNLLKIVPWEQRNEALKEATVLINTTSMGMVGQPELDININYLPKYTLVTDIVYRPLITPLLQAAKDRDNLIVDGLGMLLYQAVPGFKMWFADELNAKGIEKVEVTKELRDKIEALL